MLPQTLPSAPVSHSLGNRKCTVFDIALGTYSPLPPDTVYITTDIIICTSLLQSKISLRPLSQATSSTELRPLFRIFLRELRLCSFCSGPFTRSEKQQSVVDIINYFVAIFVHCFTRHSSILTPQHRNRQVIFVTSFSFERRIELTHVIFRLQRVDRN